jgi:hypothetical protein
LVQKGNNLLKNSYLNISITLTLAALAFLLYSSSPTWAQYNHPELKWHTIKTPHFFIFYHEGKFMEEIAHDVADIAETVYGRITELYDYQMDERVPIIVYGNEDITNGFADPIFPRITLYTPFIGNLADYRGMHDEWLINLIAHEFSHVVHLRSAWGFPAYLRYILGGIVIPNALSPNYYVEALGQYGSQAIGADGWDAHRDMVMRQRVLNDDLYTYRQMVGINQQQTPYGESHYNSGLSFVNYLVERYGPDAINRINRTNNGTSLLGFDWALGSATGGKNFDDLYREWEGHLREVYSKQKEKVLKEGTYPEVKHLWPHIEAGGAARYSDDGKSIAFTGRERFYQSYSLYIAPSSGGEPQKAADEVSRDFLDWRGNRVIYVKAERNPNGSLINDLYVYNYTAKETKRLTDGLRGYYPASSPDGSRIALVRNENGTPNIFTINADGGNLKQITHTDHRAIYNDLRWSPDGMKILFSKFDGKRMSVYLIDADGSNLRTLIYDRYENLNPLWSPDGESIIFSSDRNGIFNLYELRLSDNRLFRLTNTLGGLFAQDFKNGGLLLASYTNEGYKVGTVQYRPVEIGLYQIDPSIDENHITVERGTYEDLHYYNPFDTLHPIFSYPSVGIEGGGSLLLGGGTVIGDALGQHDLTLNGLYSLQAEKVEDGLNGEAIYTNWMLYPTLTLRGFHVTNGIPIGGKTYRWRTYGGSVAASFPFLTHFNLGLGYGYQRSQPITDLSQLKEEDRPELGVVTGPSAFWSFGKERSSLEWGDGIFAQISYERSDRALGSDFNFNLIESGFTLLTALPLKNNTIRTRLRASYVDGDGGDLLLGGSDLMRGYGGFSVPFLLGNKFMAGSVDYTFPLIPDLGWKFWMLYFDRLVGSLYAEAGAIWSGDSPDTSNIHADIGLEMGLPISFFYLPAIIGPKVGVAYNSGRLVNWYVGIQTAF